MLILLSPAKTLDYGPDIGQGLQLPKFRRQSSELIKILREYSPNKLKSLMHISDKLADLNYERNQKFSSRYTDKNSRAAILAFKGDVYLGLDAESLNKKDLEFAENHVRILSGLYGLLSPLDKMQPYRLEMGTSLKNEAGKNLYAFWQPILTKEVNKLLKNNKQPLLVNLASKEYFSALDKKSIKAEILDITFKEYRNDKLTFISFNAKKARGLMTRFITKERILSKEEIKGFNYEYYSFDDALSTENNYVFVR